MAVRSTFRLSLCSLLSVAALLAVALPALAAPQYNFNCNSCHGMPPTDGSLRDPRDGSFPGNHATHQPVSAGASDCAKCHVTTGFTNGHMDGRVSFPASLNNSPATAQYKVTGAAVSFKNQTSVPVLGNCSNANCHFETATPVWGSSRYASTSDCSACHASPGASTPHAAHDRYYSGVSGCVKCHPDWATGLKFSHATSAGNRGIRVTMVEGTYSGSGLNFLPSQSASRTLGTCSALYCHSDGTRNSAFTVATDPSWSAAPGSLACTGCHGGTATLATGSHAGHLASDMSGNLNCVQCHSATVNTAGGIASVADHVDRFVTIKFASSTTAVNGTYDGQAASTAAAKKLPGSAAGSCANVYCHSDGTKGTAPLVGKSPTPTWGSAAMNCTSCHGGGLGSAAFKSISTGRHAKHVLGAYKYNYSCATCHAATVTGNTTITDRSKHVNSRVDVTFSGVAKTGNADAIFTTAGHAPGQTGTVDDSCRNVYCHSNAQAGGQSGTAFRFRNLTGSKRWTATGTISGCTSCHGSSSTTTGDWTLSGKHLAHVSTTINPAIGKVLACNDCHASGGTNFTRAKHSDGFINYSAILAGKQSTIDLATGTCSAAYCHSNGKGTYKPMASTNWFSSASLDCKGCHGSEASPAFASKAGEPNYAAGNSHEKHVTAAADCYTCHRTTTNAAGALFATTTHVNQAINVNIPKLAGFNNLSGVYNVTTKTCSATYCHSNGTPVWGNAASGACGTCHDANAAIAGAGKPTIATNGHDSHLTLTYGPGAYLGTAVTSCQTCHTGYVGGAGHVNGVAAYADGAGTACFNCHAGTVPAWSAAQHSISCETCHGSTPARLPNGVAAPSKTAGFIASGHGKYAITNSCASCHDQNSAHISGILGDTKRLLSGLGSGNTNCSYCHNNPAKVPTASFRNMSTHFTAKGGGQTMGCNACHDPHGTGNLSMIKSAIAFINSTTWNISYTNRATGWVDLVTNRGLCQVCHTQTAYYRAGVPETRHYTGNCFDCHLHNAAGGAFKVSGNCDTCHGYPPVPRQTATAFTFGTEGNYADARYEDYSGGGGAHVVNTHVPKTAKASDGWTPCLTCHNGGDATHVKVGPIASHIGNVSVEVKQNYKKYNVNQFITYSGAKLVSRPAVNATGSCYNSSCHYRPSPRWSTER